MTTSLRPIWNHLRLYCSQRRWKLCCRYCLVIRLRSIIYFFVEILGRLMKRKGTANNLAVLDAPIWKQRWWSLLGHSFIRHWSQGIISWNVIISIYLLKNVWILFKDLIFLIYNTLFNHGCSFSLFLFQSQLLHFSDFVEHMGNWVAWFSFQEMRHDLWKNWFYFGF